MIDILTRLIIFIITLFSYFRFNNTNDCPVEESFSESSESCDNDTFDTDQGKLYLKKDVIFKTLDSRSLVSSTNNKYNYNFTYDKIGCDKDSSINLINLHIINEKKNLGETVCKIESTDMICIIDNNGKKYYPKYSTEEQYYLKYKKYKNSNKIKIYSLQKINKCDVEVKLQKNNEGKYFFFETKNGILLKPINQDKKYIKHLNKNINIIYIIEKTQKDCIYVIVLAYS